MLMTSAPTENGRTVTAMDEFTNEMLLGSAIQLIKDMERISFLGERMDCLHIHQMAKDWLQRLEGDSNG